MGSERITIKGCVGTELTSEMVSGATHIWTKRAIVDVPVGVERWDEEPGEEEPEMEAEEGKVTG